jgi:SET domain-containing protein
MPIPKKPVLPTTDPIEVRHSPVHGHGVFASRDLPRGTQLGIYAGKRYTERQAGTRTWDDKLTYLFGLSDGSVIDGGDGGNATRHLNHACTPNCQAVESVGARKKLTVAIETLRRVKAGEELFIDYTLQIDATDDPANYLCRCGLTDCRGTMAAPTER